MSDVKQIALDWVDRNAADLSAWTKTIWAFAEPAFAAGVAATKLAWRG